MTSIGDQLDPNYRVRKKKKINETPILVTPSSINV